MSVACRRKSYGASLIELVIAITILAILAVAATPHLRDLIRRNKITVATHRLLTDLSYARVAATHRGSYASMCPSTDGTRCEPGVAQSRGRIVYAYQPGKARKAAPFDSSPAAGNILLRHTPVDPNISITMKNGAIVSFDAEGNLTASNRIVEFHVCYQFADGTAVSSVRTPGKKLTVTHSGRPSVTNMAPGDACT